MRFLRRLILLILFLGVAGLIVAFTLPADLALRWFKPNLGPVQVAGVSGTLWHGRAASVTVFGTPVGALDWQVDKAPVLLRQIVARLNLSGGSITAKGEVMRDPDGSIAADNVDFAFPAELAAPALDIPSLKLLGRVDGHIDEARLAGGWVHGARGKARWRDAGVTGEAEARFGDLTVEFASKGDHSIAGTVKDDGTSGLIVDGQFVVQGGQFDVTARLSARNGDPQVQEALRYIGQLQPDGSSLLKIHGQLFKLL
ncbi:type II secretion system protein N [Tahibacter amnicola]|uniref:Type II secretion system protein N n=1 Tax=Tahibacter amnicola TaxID=2976241 RepID=A0ABY6BDA3_9GAMM|nr:type II secretion system protein N [Tahibacter amnicola]UXI67561.1 type II secretion system protein N [Tahibacter amnicola]